MTDGQRQDQQHQTQQPASGCWCRRRCSRPASSSRGTPSCAPCRPRPRRRHPSRGSLSTSQLTHRGSIPSSTAYRHVMITDRRLIVRLGPSPAYSMLGVLAEHLDALQLGRSAGSCRPDRRERFIGSHPTGNMPETLARHCVAFNGPRQRMEQWMDSGSLAWVLVSAALVLFMTPGLAFFYGGMDRGRNVLNMLMMNFYCVLIVPVLWVVVGYSLAQTPFEQRLHRRASTRSFLKDIDRRRRRRQPRRSSPSWACSRRSRRR